MARIHVLPSIDIIRGLKGVLDFYLWRGLPCVRAWPRWRPARQTDASVAAALLFGAVIKAFALTHTAVLEQLAIEATGIPRTTRDIYVSGVYGNLHEASMSDFLTLLQQSRDFLSDLTALLEALHSIDTDEIVTRVEHSVLPDSAATAAAQATQLTALQKLDDLQDTLESKALDRLLVRGMDQLFSFRDPLGRYRATIISGPGGYVDSTPCAGNEIWCITSITARDRTNPTTIHHYQLRHAGSDYSFAETVAAFPTNQSSFWKGRQWLTFGDTIRVLFTGALAGDNCSITLTGYIMTLET